MFLIQVKGEIFASDKNHYAQGWTCFDTSNPITDIAYSYDSKSRQVLGNLILDKRRRAVPYALYVSEKGISCELPGEIIYAPGEMAAELCYKDNIAEIQNLLRIKIPSETEAYFYNGLLTGIFSIFELFLSDVLLCIIYTNNEVYLRAVDYYKSKRNSCGNNLDYEIQKYFTSEVVYHKFDQVDKLFKYVLDITIPDAKQIREYLHKRNNIVHRFAFSNLDRMSIATINIEDLESLIMRCNEFVTTLMITISNKYNHTHS